MFYYAATRFAGQVRNRCSRATCPGWLPVIPTRRHTGSLHFPHPHKWTPTFTFLAPLSRDGRGAGGEGMVGGRAVDPAASAASKGLTRFAFIG